MRSLGVEGLAIIPDAVLTSESVAAMIAELALANKLPSVGDRSAQVQSDNIVVLTRSVAEGELS
jgi:hypothetical protein